MSDIDIVYNGFKNKYFGFCAVIKDLFQSFLISWLKALKGHSSLQIPTRLSCGRRIRFIPVAPEGRTHASEWKRGKFQLECEMSF